jgi:hypothetical protein
VRKEVRNELAGDFAEKMQKVQENAQAVLRQAAERMKTSYDKGTRLAIKYQPGDKVYLEATNLKTNQPSKKLDNKQFGPFQVKKKVGEAAYELELPPNWPRIHP